MTAAAVFTETAAIREAGYLRRRFQDAANSALGYVAADELAEALTNLAGGREDAFSLKAAADELFAMDEKSRIESVPGLSEDDPKSYRAACLAA